MTRRHSVHAQSFWHYWHAPQPLRSAPHWCGTCLRLTQDHAPLLARIAHRVRHPVQSWRARRWTP